MQHHLFFENLINRYDERYHHLLPHIKVVDKTGTTPPSIKLITRPTCYSFHDVDLIPEDDRNLFACLNDISIHQCDKYTKFDYITQYASGRHITAGGSSLISHDQYKYTNGHPNSFFGWGVEDIEMAERLREKPDEKKMLDLQPLISDSDIAKFRIVTIQNGLEPDFDKLIKDGITKQGGGDGFYRMDKYGYYYSVAHQHGFTSGPAMLKSHTDALKNSGNKDRETNENISMHGKKATNDISQYDIIPSPLEKPLLRQNYIKFKELMPKNPISSTEILKLAEKIAGKIGSGQYPSGEPLETQFFDGVLDTSYHKLGYFPEKFYGKYTVDIRPASIEKCQIRAHFDHQTQNEEIETLLLDIAPDKDLFNSIECNLKTFQNSSLLQTEELMELFAKIKYHSKIRGTARSYDSRKEMAFNFCDKLERVSMGECNAFHLIDPAKGSVEMPHPIKTFYPTKQFLADNKWEPEFFDTFVKDCPTKIGLFQIAQETLFVDTDDYQKIISDESNLLDPQHLDFSKDDRQIMKLNLEYDLNIRQVPAGGLVFTDHLHYEGQHHSTRFLQLSPSSELQLPYDYENSDLKIYGEHHSKTDKYSAYEGLTISLQKTSKTSIKLKISLKIKNALPGFYLYRISLSDYFGQPYLNQNFLTRIQIKDNSIDKKFHQLREKYYVDIQAQIFNNMTYLNEKYYYQDPGWKLLQNNYLRDNYSLQLFRKLARSYGFDLDSDVLNLSDDDLCKLTIYKRTNQTEIMSCHSKEKVCDMFKDTLDSSNSLEEDENIAKFVKRHNIDQKC